MLPALSQSRPHLSLDRLASAWRPVIASPRYATDLSPSLSCCVPLRPSSSDYRDEQDCQLLESASFGLTLPHHQLPLFEVMSALFHCHYSSIARRFGLPLQHCPAHYSSRYPGALAYLNQRSSGSSFRQVSIGARLNYRSRSVRSRRIFPLVRGCCASDQIGASLRE